MILQQFRALVALSALGLAGGGVCAADFFTDQAAFNAAAAAYGARHVESFEAEPDATTPTSFSYPGVTFSCVGLGHCPGFFGRGDALSSDGRRSVFAATPASMVFTFTAPVTVLAVDLLGLGDVGPTDFTVQLSNGHSTTLFSALDQGRDLTNFAGVIDANGFSSVTFAGSRPNDGVYFDRLQFVNSVPEPAAGALLLGGIAVVAAAVRRRRAAAAVRGF